VDLIRVFRRRLDDSDSIGITASVLANSEYLKTPQSQIVSAPRAR